jgi:transposase
MKGKFQHFLGIDVSKLKFDVCAITNPDHCVLHQEVFDQSRTGLKLFDRWIRKITGSQNQSEILICVENTGRYHDGLVHFLYQKGYSICVENAMLIKNSIRDKRAKNDQLDARNIAFYTLEHAHELELWQKPREVVETLKALLAARSFLVNTLKSMTVRNNELDFCSWGVKMPKPYMAGLKGLKKDINQVDQDIWKLICGDKDLLRMFTLLISIPAIGKVTAAHFICYTNEFKKVMNGKHLASYCGVVPFGQSSGTSLKKKPRIRPEANKILKTLLHLCAVTAIKMKGEFNFYYQRKKAEGKNGMMILNAIRNKLVLRMAAVISKGEPYDQNYIYKK